MSTCAPTTLDEAIAGAWTDVLTDQVTVTRLTRLPDASGGSTESYRAVADLAAFIEPSGGGELIVADRLGLIDTYTITLLPQADVKVSDRLEAHGRVFHVQYVPQGGTAQVPVAVLATVVA